MVFHKPRKKDKVAQRKKGGNSRQRYEEETAAAAAAVVDNNIQDTQLQHQQQLHLLKQLIKRRRERMTIGTRIGGHSVPSGERIAKYRN